MTRLPTIWRSQRGAAAAEMALVAPLLLVILIGSVETGNYFLSEHLLVKGLRDGARYAARQSFGSYPACGTGEQSITTGTMFDNVKTLVRKGSLDSSAADRLPNWTAQGTSFTVKVECYTQTSGQPLNGIYKNMAAPVVRVAATVPYSPVLPVFRTSSIGLKLNANEQASVMGI